MDDGVEYGALPKVRDAPDAFEAGHRAAMKGSRFPWAFSARDELLEWLAHHHADIYREFWRGYYYPHEDVDDDLP